MSRRKHASYVLQMVLARACASSASEVRFVSGLCPAVLDADGLRWVEVADLQSETVYEINRECLELAGLEAESGAPLQVYLLPVEGLGVLRCRFELRENVASLVMRVDESEVEPVGVIAPVRRPRQGTSAEAEPSGEGDA